jgi:hypothetical protein
MSLRSDPEKMKIYKRNWARTRRESRKQQTRELRNKVLNYLGGKCVYCGCNIPEVLEINHKNGGGNKERVNGIYQNNNQHLKSILDGKRKNDFELTCKICNSWHYLVKIKGIPNRWVITFI